MLRGAGAGVGRDEEEVCAVLMRAEGRSVDVTAPVTGSKDL